MTKTLLRGACILTMDPAVGDLPKGDVLVDGDRIAAVAPFLEGDGAAVVDGKGMILAPGLINGHIHTWETALRGIGADWAGSDYFNFFHAGLAPLFTPEDTRIGTLMGALAQLDGGVTTIMDFCHNNRTPAHSDAAVEGLQEAGIRAIFGHGTVKNPSVAGQPHFSQVPHPMQEIYRLRRGALSDDNALVTLAMAILGPDYSTLDVCRQDFGAAKDLDIFTTAHVWGRDNRLVPGGYHTIAAEKLLTHKHNIVHGNYFEDDELKVVIDHGASFTSTAACEMSYHVRQPLTGRVRRLGGTPSIGIDSEVSGKGDMFHAMRSELMINRLYANMDTLRRLEAEGANAATPKRAKGTIGTGGSPFEKVSIPTREALYWATMGNARALHLDSRVGSITPGKQADLILIRTDAMHIVSSQDPVQTVVCYAQPSDVDTVMVGGRIVKQNGRLVRQNTQRLKDELRVSAERLLAAAKSAQAGRT